jgi:tetratricopeptide (TPR) repeat protein
VPSIRPPAWALLWGAPCALHAALALWAVAAWQAGPFEGAAILDGAEVLYAAEHGRAEVYSTKSPLYPWLLGLLLGGEGAAPWTVGLLGTGCSLAVLIGVGLLCRRVGCPRAAPWAMGCYALSGSVLAFVPQPLPALLTTACLLWGVLLIAPSGPGDGRGAALLGGGLLACSFAATAAVLPAAVLALWTGRRRIFVALGALLVVVWAAALFGQRLWPEGGPLNLRLGNGAERSGTSDLRPGPAYDRLRYEPVFAAWEAGASAVAPDHHLLRLGEELAADPSGALRTLTRKLFLSVHRTEIATGADFRYGLSLLPFLPWLLLSFGLIAPLALASLRHARPLSLWAPVLGVLAANVLFLTSARYRFPALPFLCVAAGLWCARRPRRPDLALAAGLALLLNLDMAGLDPVWPGDGPAQAGRHLLAAPDRLAEAHERLTEALRQGRDPRVRYDLGLVCEKLALDPGAEPAASLELLASAERVWREALSLDPLYPQPAENLMRLMLRQGRVDEAIELGRQLVADNPYAAYARLNLAAALVARDGDAPVEALLVDGHLRGALRALSQAEFAIARQHARELTLLGRRDRRLEALIDSTDSNHRY